MILKKIKANSFKFSLGFSEDGNRDKSGKYFLTANLG